MVRGAKVRGAKVKAWQRGRNAERLAAWYLRAKGYRILAERYKTPSGEIDLIATRLAKPFANRGRHLVFVEVKARATLQDGLEAISPRQQQRIRAAAETFLTRNASGTGRGTSLAPRMVQCRFDAIVVPPGPFGLPHITHRPNAWT